MWQQHYLHCPSNLGIDEWLREANWSKCLVLTYKEGATQKFIILKGQQHNWKHKVGRYPAAHLAFHCRWQSKWNMFSGLIVNDTELHSIYSIEFLKVLQQQAITALYHIQYEITSFFRNGNVATDIFLHRQNDNRRVMQNWCKGEIGKARWKKKRLT